MQENIFHLENVSFTFSDGFNIFKDINLDIYKKDVVLVKGESGSGKSTLIKILARLNTIDSGLIEYKGANIYDLDVTKYRKEVSYFFQNALLFDHTVRDNLEFPYKIRKEKFNQERAVQWLEKVSLSESYLDKSIEDLSGGERQRVAFVRNLQYLPEVLLLDEVTSSLDSKNTEILAGIVSELVESEDITVLAISHNESESLDYTKEIFIKDGRVENR